MAEKQRNDLYSKSSQNINCSNYTVSPCPEPHDNNGYPYVPLLSPHPSPSPPPAAGESNHNFITSPYFIILVSLVAGLFLLLCYYGIIVKPFAPFRRQRHSRANRLTPGQSGDEFQDDNMTFHPVWLIATIGLQQSVIDSITLCRYKSGEGLIEGTECSVCLSAFQENEKLRLLPKCSHAFHIPCIDTWLRSHTNCPLCRVRILSDQTSGVPSGAVEQSSEDLDTNGASRVGNDENRTTETEQNTVQDENTSLSKEVTGHGDQLLEGNEMHSLQGSGSLNSWLSNSFFINMPDVYSNNILEEAQEHNSIVVAEANSEH